MTAETVPQTQTSTQPAEASGGMPQFQFSNWPGQMVWLLLIFVVLYILFARVFVPKIGGVIADREDRISGDIGDARRLKAEADATAAEAAAEMAQARASVQKMVLDARAKARAEAAARAAAEDAKINEVLARSEIVLAEARATAMSHVAGIAQETAALIVGKLTGVEATADEVTSAAAGA